jgi:hypothetical protein
MARYYWHSLQSLIINHNIHLVLTIDEAVSKDRFDLNVVIDTREVKSKMGLFDAVPRF